MKNRQAALGIVARAALIGGLLAAAGMAHAGKMVGPVTTAKMVCIFHPGGHMECTKVK